MFFIGMGVGFLIGGCIGMFLISACVIAKDR